MIKGIVFDLDGTILDTLEDLADTMNYCLKKYNMPTRSLEEIRSFVGNGILKIVERSVPQETSSDIIAEIYNLFNLYYKDHCMDKTKPYDGIVDTIIEIKKLGYKIGVVSNKADYAVQTLCERYFKGLIDYSVGAKETQRKKPYPDSVFDAMNHFCITKDEVVYIGDSEVDIETTKNAEIPLILVDWGFRDRKYLESFGVETIISFPNELLKLI